LSCCCFVLSICRWKLFFGLSFLTQPPHERQKKK
jgi:hypothetical protein